MEQGGGKRLGPALLHGRVRAAWQGRAEWTAAWLLGVHLCLLILGLTTGRAASSALFLERYDAPELAFLYMLVGGAVIVAHGLLRWLTQYYAAVRVAQFTVAVQAVGTLLLWGRLPAADPEHHSLITGALCLWLEVFSFITTLQFWTLANRTFSEARARNWYVWIGSGGIVGSILGGVLAGFASPDFLLGFGVVVTIAVTCVIEAFCRMTPSEIAVPNVADPSAAPRLDTSFRRFALPLAMLTILTIFTTTLCDFYFKHLADVACAGEPVSLVSTFGNYYLAVGLLTLALQFLGTPWLLRRTHVFTGLTVLPYTIGIVALLNLLSPGLAMATILRLSDSVLTHSVNRSCREYLFTHLPRFQRTHLQDMCDGFAGRLGLLIAGLFLWSATALLPAAGSTGYLIFLSVCIFAWLLTLAWLRGACPQEVAQDPPNVTASPPLRIPVDVAHRAA